VGGTAVYQPADGTNVADYLVAAGSLGSEVHVLYCTACEGAFSRLIRFETPEAQLTAGLTGLLAACLDEAASDSIGVVMVAEASGLVGTALRRSPAVPIPDSDLFAYPGIRSRLSFTAERVFPRSVALVGGIVTRSAAGATHPQLRPLAGGLHGHLHAAAFRFNPVRKGFIELAPTVADLFEGGRPLGVIHLLHDDRGPAGVGESEFTRGAAWIGALEF
jgi:hypothetical protein